jgi:hypothetical protein
MLLACCFCASAAVQESSSRADASLPASASVGTPSAALRDTLVAACAHNEKSFRQFLTARNAESFSRMTDAARIELMKRFVLLADPGIPSVSSTPDGRPVIRCQTSEGAAEISVGGTDLRDNLAFLPVDLRDAADPSSSDVHHVLMGLVREDGQWKILSIGLLFLDLPSLEVEWDRAESAENEQAALATLKSLASAIETYRRTYTHLPESLSQLEPPGKGAPRLNAAGLIDAALASGSKNGYSFRYVIVGASDLGAPAKYELSAAPQPYGHAGKLSFFRDSAGNYHAADHHGAVGAETDPKIQ